MEFVTKLDIEIYTPVTNKIRSNALFLTNSQKEHIIKRRGLEFFQKYSPYFGDVAKDPDYIFRDKRHPNTAIACKTISLDGKNINLIIRLATVDDSSELENSIITAIVENNRRYQQRLRNNIPLYKKEY